MDLILKKILGLHIAALTLVASASLYFVSSDLSGSYSGFFWTSLKFFWGVFFVGALVLGMGEVLRPALTIGSYLVRGSDLNDDLFRGQLQRFIVFVAEIYIAIVALLLTGFVGITF